MILSRLRKSMISILHALFLSISFSSSTYTTSFLNAFMLFTGSSDSSPSSSSISSSSSSSSTSGTSASFTSSSSCMSSSSSVPSSSSESARALLFLVAVSFYLCCLIRRFSFLLRGAAAWVSTVAAVPSSRNMMSTRSALAADARCVGAFPEVRRV